MADLRREIINTLINAFVNVRDNPARASRKNPCGLAVSYPNSQCPIDLKDKPDWLPAVSFEYGGSRRIEGAFTQEETNIFSVYVYPVITTIAGIGGSIEGFDPNFVGDDLMEAASAVEETIRLIAQDLNAYQIEFENDYVDGVSVGQVEAGRDAPTQYIFMEARIDFRVNYEIPLETGV